MRYGTIDHEYGARLATTPEAEDGPVYMLNLMKYRAAADYGADGEQGVSGREADDRYAPLDVLAAIGAAVVFVGDVVESSEDWDRVAVVRYPTRRSFIDMQARRDFKEKHVHKDAGMDHTIIVGSLPDGALPATGADRLRLELWDGEAPPGDGATFTVEGTIVGDGRRWTGVRWGPADGEPAAASPSHQVLELAPSRERWT